MTIDVTGNYTHWENTEAVTVTFGQQADTPTVVEVAMAARRQVNRDELLFGGLSFAPDTVVWLLPNALLEGNEPQPGTIITDANGIDYFVDSPITKRSLGGIVSHWRCATKRNPAT